MLLLHTKGAKSGAERVNPLAYRVDGDALVDWFHNLRADPRVTVEVGTETREVVARVADAEERHRLWEAQKVDSPGFADYETKASRQIPVVILDPVAS